MPNQVTFGNAKILSSSNDLACPNHHGSEIQEAELYQYGFHKYRGYICKDCAKDYFQDSVKGLMAEVVSASQRKASRLEKVMGCLLDGEGRQYKTLIEGEPIMGPSESFASLVGYICPECGIVEGLPIACKRSVSDEARISFAEKEYCVRCYEFMCGQGEVSIEPMSEKNRHYLDNAIIYVCGSCSKWIGASTGKEYYC
jgi:hypothetical protein